MASPPPTGKLHMVPRCGRAEGAKGEPSPRGLRELGPVDCESWAVSGQPGGLKHHLAGASPEQRQEHALGKEKLTPEASGMLASWCPVPSSLPAVKRIGALQPE